MSTSQQQGSQAPWLPVYIALATVALVVVARFQIAPTLTWWHMPIVAFAGLVVTFIFTLLQESQRGGHPWARVFGHRMLIWAAAGAWAAWTDVVGFGLWPVLSIIGGTAALSVLGLVCPTPNTGPPQQRVATTPGADRRHPIIREWEARIRSITKLSVVVTHWEPWENERDGLRLFADLPAEQGTTTADLAAVASRLAHAARLPVGCAVRVLDSDRQGVVVIDVMLRNSLLDEGEVYVEPTTPASINDDFPVLATPRGELLSICLRIMSMVIGGTTGSGKTTLLHRIIMWLARCTDALVWVVDLNGGGVAEPWISPWANRRTVAPVVDWVADNEEEAAVMAAVAGAIARDRKTNREAVRRKKAANNMVLPVDATMPAIVVLTDEGGEVRQAVSLLGQLAGQGITRLAQIGRAEGVRVIMSVLRGTSDLTDKGLRVHAGLRLCLRMEEHDEYTHVLGANPGPTELSGAEGAGYLRTPTIPRPVLGRTVNVDLAGIDSHAVVCGPLRPTLDEWALRVAAQVTPAAVLGGRQPTREHMVMPIMQDAAAGRAYTGRWERYAAKLAEMRGETYDDEPETVTDETSVPTMTPASTRTSALDAWAATVEGPSAAASSAPVPMPRSTVEEKGESATIIQFPNSPDQTAAKAAPVSMTADTAREQIMTLVKHAGTTGITAGDIERQVDVARSRVYALLKALREENTITQNPQGLYVTPNNAKATTG